MWEGLGLGVGLGLGNQIAISTRGVIIWQGVENGHNTGSPACSTWLRKKIILHLKKKLVDITFESMSSPTNGIRGAQLSLPTKLTLLANWNFLLL